MYRILLFLGVVGIGLCPLPSSAQNPNAIRLVLQITVDGLRADLLTRYGDHFGQGGFQYLMDKGVVFTNVHYQHANTETIVGHTTLATGASPSRHGMVGNVWFDENTGELSYNIEDPKHPLLPTKQANMKGSQVDPAQRLSRTQGRSPSAILIPTFSDELKAFFGGRSKIFGVSGKDRSAVSMAGHTGKAFWYSTDNGDFLTSTYYYDSYPKWVQEWNDKRQVEEYAGTSWQLHHEQSTYLLRDQDDRPYEVDLKGYGRVFPHSFGDITHKLFFTRILVSPVGDQLTLDFSKVLIKEEQLGQDDIPDYLSISFSSVDAVNHFFGPSSLENEDVVLQLDRTLADLLQFIDAAVGLNNTLIVLSADHGMADMPEYMTGFGYSVGRIYPDEVIKIANKAGNRLFGIEGLARTFFRPYLYLDQEKIAGAHLDIQKVEQGIARELAKKKGIALAVPRSGVSPFQTNPLLQQIQRNYHPSRSGDIYIVQEPYWFMYNKGPVAAMHGSPWRYDTHVPLIFSGPTIGAKRVHRSVYPVDVAPTLAAFLGMTPPSSATGTPLEEVLH